MLQHLRANLWLLVLTLLICSLLYPLVLWGIGQGLFPEGANGSIIVDKDGKPVGSRLIGQPFTKDEYFQPRPSSAGSGNGYNAAASGASNFGANNPLLRDRVARQLGPAVRYRSGSRVGPDIEAWFKEQPAGFVAKWADDHGTLAEQWIKDNTDAAALWLGKDADAVKSDTGAAAKEFFADFTKRHPRAWPGVEDVKGLDDKTVKEVKPLRDGPDVQAYLFDAWLQAHPKVDLEPVPADMVMASGSGLDPHITLKNARYQLDHRLAEAWAKKIKGEPDKAPAADKDRVSREVEQLKGQIKDEVTQVLNDKAFAPLGGLVGVKMVNVLEINLALRDRYEPSAAK